MEGSLLGGRTKEHRRAQIRRVARETTPEQRFMWLEEAYNFMLAAGVKNPCAQKRRARGEDWGPQAGWVANEATPPGN